MKMKQLLLATIAVPALMIGQAHAVDNASTIIVSGDKISNIDDCTLLSASVTVELSNNVEGAYYCEKDSGTLTSGWLFFGTCHQTGSTADRTVDCAGAGDPIAECTDTNPVTLSGRAAFLGSSDGGVINGLNLDDTDCDADSAAIQTRVGSYRAEKLAAETAAQ